MKTYIDSRYLCLILALLIAVLASNKATATIHDALNSVFSIEVRDERGNKIGTGSGVVATADGLAITCYHVLASASSAEAKLHDGTTATIAGYYHIDEKQDFAIIQLDSSKTYTPIQFGDMSSVKVGDRVFTIGSPQGFEGTIADGIVSAIRVLDPFGRVIQTTAPISPGSSGGALTDAQGRLIGITKFYRKDSQNLNFATPVDEIAPHIQATSLTSFKDMPKREMSIDVLAALPKLYNLIAEDGIYARIAFILAGDLDELSRDKATIPLYAMSLSHSGDFREAQDAIRGYIREYGRNTDIECAIAYWHLKMASFESDLDNRAAADRNYDRARASALEILRGDESHALACSIYLATLLGLRRYEDLEYDAIVAIRTFPDSMFPWQWRLFSLALVGRYADARTFSNRLLQRRDFDAGTVYYWRGLIRTWELQAHGRRDSHARALALDAMQDFVRASERGNSMDALRGLNRLQALGY